MWFGYVAYKEEKRDASRVLVQYLKERSHLEDLGVVERMILTHCRRACLLIKYALVTGLLNAFNVHSHNILQAYRSKIRLKSGLSACNLRSKHPACS